MKRAPGRKLRKSTLVVWLATAAAYACAGEGVAERAKPDERRVVTLREGSDAEGATREGNDNDVEGASLVGRVVPADGAAFVGRVAPADGTARSAGRALVVVNGASRVVPLAPDGAFLVRGLPLGDVTVKVELGGVPGAVVLGDVASGELLEVSIESRADHLALELARRAAPAARRPAATLRGHDVAFRLAPGVHEGDLRLEGDGVFALGADEGEACDDARRTIVAGDLVIEGDDVTVFDVAVRGAFVARGERVRAFDSCSGAYFDVRDGGAEPTGPGAGRHETNQIWFCSAETPARVCAEQS